MSQSQVRSPFIHYMQRKLNVYVSASGFTALHVTTDRKETKEASLKPADSNEPQPVLPPDVISMAFRQAASYLASGDLVNAKEALQQMHQSQVQFLGADHKDTLSTLHNIAKVTHEMGDVDEAIKLLVQIYDRSRYSLGWTDTFTGEVALLLGSSYAKNRAWEKAKTVYIDILEDRKHPDFSDINDIVALQCKSLLAIAHCYLGEFKLARDLLIETLEMGTSFEDEKATPFLENCRSLLPTVIGALEMDAQATQARAIFGSNSSSQSDGRYQSSSNVFA